MAAGARAAKLKHHVEKSSSANHCKNWRRMCPDDRTSRTGTMMRNMMPQWMPRMLAPTGRPLAQHKPLAFASWIKAVMVRM